MGRIKILGQDEPELLEQLSPDNYRARVERGFIIHVEAFDWNCPQHIPQRMTLEELEPQLKPVRDEIVQLRAENEKLKIALGQKI